jgi:chemotaxis protein methyltransferase CheR
MILCEEAAKLAGWRVDILATDLSTDILHRAKEGAYSQFEVQRGLPIAMLMKYFEQVGDRWQVVPKVRDMVTYRTFNLLGDPALLGRFDIVFCRNVLIYFEQPTKAKVLAGIARQMPGDGILYLGGAETVIGVSDRFQLIEGQRGVYSVATLGAAAPAASAPARLAVG